MFKKIKEKIQIFNDNLDYGNYEEHLEFCEWITYIILSIFIPIPIGIALTIFKNDYFFLCMGIIISIVLICYWCSKIELIPISYLSAKIQKIDSIKFIWGIKSYDDLTYYEANIYSLNDIELTYDSKRKIYSLGIEGIYSFFDKENGEIIYLRRLLNEFTNFMIKNNYDLNHKMSLIEVCNEFNIFEADSIPQLYTQFKMLVEGFSIVCKGEE